MKVLVVDDSEMVRLLLANIVGHEGHVAAQAADGREALEAMAREPFNLVFMDVRMPRLDGLEATDAIRRGEIGGVDPGIPIVGITGSGDLERDCRAAGMNDFASKPISLKQVLGLLKRYTAPQRHTPIC